VSKRVKQVYNTEFRDSAVKMVICSEKSTAQIAKDLGIKETPLIWLDK